MAAKKTTKKTSRRAPSSATKTAPAAPAAPAATKAVPFDREANAALALAVRSGKGIEFGIPNGNYSTGERERPRRGAFSETGERIVVYRVFAATIRDLGSTKEGIGEAEIVAEAERRVLAVDPYYPRVLPRLRTFYREVRNRAAGGIDGHKGPYGAGPGELGSGAPSGGVVYAPNGDGGALRLRYVADAAANVGYSRPTT